MRQLPGMKPAIRGTKPIAQPRPRRALPWILPPHLARSQGRVNALAERRDDRPPSPRGRLA
jgi:hypothetical protein